MAASRALPATKAGLGCAGVGIILAACLFALPVKAASSPKPSPGMVEFNKVIHPILEERCSDCHGGGRHKGGVAFETLKTEDDVLHNPELWLKVLKNTRAGIMPADGSPRPSPAEQAALEKWIKFTAFGVDPQNFDPGTVTVRRLNRVEYHNTIRDLLGVDYNVDVELRMDDTVIPILVPSPRLRVKIFRNESRALNPGTRRIANSSPSPP